MRPMRRPASDPAPSRAAYRLHRMMLTPAFRRFLRLGLPALLVLASAGAYLSDEARRLDLVAWAADVQRSIEERPEFMVHLMDVRGASLPVTDAIRQAVPLEFPLSSFDIDLADVQARVVAIEAVASAEVQVRSGGVLMVEVSERVPVALWRDETGLHLIDLDGHRVVRVERRGERPDLPLLAGVGADRAVAEALDLLDVAGPITPRLRGLLRVGERRWDLVLDRDQRVMLPEAGAVDALLRVMALNDAQDLLERDIALVDMRNPERPVVRMTPMGVEGLRQIYERQVREN